MIKEKSLRFKTKILTLMLKTETSKSTTEEMMTDNNGQLSMLTNTLNQRRESLTSNSAFMLREISILFQLYQVEDTLILLTIGTWLPRLQMEERPKFGTSINSQRPSEPDTTTNHSTSRTLERLETCKSGAPTQDGGKFSKCKVNSLSIQPTTRFSKSPHRKMMKELLLLLTTGMVTKTIMPTKDGRLYISTKLKQLELRASTKSSVSTSTDHSTSDQECQCKELLNAMVPTMSGSEDGERTLLLNNGTSMRSPRPSRTTTGRATHSISNPTVDLTTLDALQLTQGGGKCSNTKELQLSTREEKFWKSSETLMLNRETLVLTNNRTVSGNNGTSCMLTNGRVNLKRVNSTRSSVSSLREISMLFLNCQITDTLT